MKNGAADLSAIIMGVVMGVVVASLWLPLNSAHAQEKPSYLDANAPVEARVNDLLGRMSLEEKVGQMLSDWPGTKDRIDSLAGGARQLTWYQGGRSPRELAEAVNDHERLGMAGSPNHIPVLLHDECLHGAMVLPGTAFPQSIAMAATFDPGLVGQVAKAIATEERAVGTRLVLAPVLNLSRDPRWGRTEETYGESSRLAADLGVAYVKPFQQRGVATAIKHFVANYGDGGVDSAAVFIEESELRNYWLRPFEAAIRQGGSLAVMASYNSINGLPATANPWLLTQVLRKDWGFNGIVISDYNGWWVKANHHVESGKLADQTLANLQACFAAGMDVPLHDSSAQRGKIVAAVRKGDLPPTLVDEVAGRILKVKFLLGLFEEPFANPAVAEQTVRCPAHIALALTAAAECLTLLKNDGGLLPLNTNRFHRIGVVGPAADKPLLGGYSRGSLPTDVSPMKGLQMRFGTDNVIHLTGAGEALAKAAALCDVVLFFGAVKEGEASDRARYDLPGGETGPGANQQNNAEGAVIIDEKEQVESLGNQVQAVRTLASLGKPVVFCLVAGSPVGLEPVIDSVKAVLICWYGGEQGGNAIAATLAGDSDPGGRLPITWPKHAGQIPIYHDPYPFGRGGIHYGDDDGKPSFPFGFGLSYTRFAMTNLMLDTKEVRLGTPVHFSVEVANLGERKGTAVVQIYLQDKAASRVRPIKRLEAYERVDLEPGQQRKVAFELTGENLGFYDAVGQWHVEPGEFEIQAGDSSENLPLKTVVTLVP